MYQIPVPSVEKIRKTRRKVKTVLSEFGLEECQNLLTELHKDPDVNSDEDDAFEETEWNDFTDGFNVKMKKKWPYRTKALCCSLCSYSTKNPYCFQSHISRIHQYEKKECNQGVCSQCPFVGSAKKLKRHAMLFHNASLLAPPPEPQPRAPEPPKQKVPVPLATHRPNERYQCRKCGFPTGSIFPLKKHIILKHLPNLAQQYIGYKIDNQTKLRIYCCRLCKLQTGSLDHVLHHLLVEPVHIMVSNQVQTMITEKKFYASATPNGVQSVAGFGGYSTFSFIAPKPQPPHVLSNGSLVLQPNQQQPGTLMALPQMQGAPTNLICPPGPNQTLLPPQASALVQLASAEAKGLLQPGAHLALQGALAQGRPMVQFPNTAPSTSLKQPMPAAAPVPRPLMHSPPSQPVVLPSGLQVNISRRPGSPPRPQKGSNLQTTPQGTMMTSQSLLNHLIPTGNKMNGLPVYTFAPVSGASSQSKGTPLAPITSGSNSPAQAAKKWITCPLCNELFPSNVYDIHTEVAHKTKAVTSKCESLAARALFLKKMPDKTVKCLVCKILLSEKGVFEHLLHGLNCVYCSALFFSIKQLVEHVREHNPTSKENCDFLRQEFRVYTNSTGKIVFPYFDINTSAPMQVIGDTEFHLALITTSFDLIFLKMQPSTHPEVCHSALKSSSLYCPFCDEKFDNALEHLQHLKQKHLVAPTIHAILKTEALKCIYCNGVYTGKVTQQAVMLHMQRCRCSPKKPAETAKAQEPVEVAPRGRGRPPGKPVMMTKPKPVEPISQPQPQPQQNLYFLQMPQMSPLIPAPPPALILQQAPPVPIPKPPAVPVETEAELESKRRLEAMLKEVIEANRREREERSIRRKREAGGEKQVSPITPETPSDPLVKLALEPTSNDAWNADTLKEFMNRYFHVSPYTSRAETEELSRRLDITKTEVTMQLSARRRSCMKNLKRNKAVVFMGFNMTELSKVKHNLFIPEQQVVEPSEQTDKANAPEAMEWSTDEPESPADSEPAEEESGEMANTVIDANVDASDKAEKSGEA